MKRLGLTILATLWIVAVAAALIWLSTLAGDGKAMAEILWFGALPATAIGAAPIIIYDSIGDRP